MIAYHHNMFQSGCIDVVQLCLRIVYIPHLAFLVIGLCQKSCAIWRKVHLPIEVLTVLLCVSVYKISFIDYKNLPGSKDIRELSSVLEVNVRLDNMGFIGEADIYEGNSDQSICGTGNCLNSSK